MNDLRFLRQQDVVDAEKLSSVQVTLIGLGSIGSVTGLYLAKMGVVNLTTFDADVVDIHNVSNQAYGMSDVGLLKANAFSKISIANPAAAPYGAAAVETMKALGLYDSLQAKVVQGNSIAQAYQFIDTGNAELGFVALSQLAKVTAGSRWVVPQSLYKPILQDAVLLKKGDDSAPARAFLAFLKTPEARAIIEKYGYGLEN